MGGGGGRPRRWRGRGGRPRGRGRWGGGHAHSVCSGPAQHEALSEYRPILSEAHRLQHHSSMVDKKLVLIPLIFICLRVWSTVRFVLTLCGSPAVQAPVLVVLHVSSPPHAPRRSPRSAGLSRCAGQRQAAGAWAPCISLPARGRERWRGSSPRGADRSAGEDLPELCQRPPHRGARRPAPRGRGRASGARRAPEPPCAPTLTRPLSLCSAAGHREHVSRRRQLHHVRALHACGPHAAPRALLLPPSPARCGEPGRLATQACHDLLDGGLSGTWLDPPRTSEHLSAACPGSVPAHSLPWTGGHREWEGRPSPESLLPLKLSTPVARAGAAAPSARLPPRPSRGTSAPRVLLHSGCLSV